MPVEIKIPEVGESITEGVLVEWSVDDGAVAAAMLNSMSSGWEQIARTFCSDMLQVLLETLLAALSCHCLASLPAARPIFFGAGGRLRRRTNCADSASGKVVSGKAHVEIEPSTLSALELYQHMTRLVAPRPIAWVSTQSVDGRTNLAPYSYFTAVGSNPPTLAFCPANRADGAAKDTLANIEQTGEFVVNVVSFDLADMMNQSSADYDAAESEFDACGIRPTPSLRVRPPRVAEAKAHLECRLHSVVKLGTGPGGANLVIGRIVAMHIQDDVLDKTGHADPTSMDLVARMGGSTYSRTTDLFDLERPSR